MEKEITLYKATLVQSGADIPPEIKIETSGDWYTLSFNDAVIALFNSLSTDDIDSLMDVTDEHKNIVIVGISLTEYPDTLLDEIPEASISGDKTSKPFRLDIRGCATQMSLFNGSIEKCDIDIKVEDDGSRTVNIKELKLLDNVSKNVMTLF